MSACASASAPAVVVWPGAMQPDVHLDEQRRARAAALEGGGEALGCGQPVDCHRQVHALGCDARQALPLVAAEGRVVHEDARRSGLLEDLGLTGLRDRQAAGAELQLPQADLGRLVRLGVRPERDAVLVAVGLQVGEIGLEPVEVDHRNRRLHLAHGASHLRGEQLERAVGSRAHRR